HNPIIIASQNNPSSSLLAPPSVYNNLLLSTPSFSSSTSTLNSLQSAQSCPSLEFSQIGIIQKQSAQIEELQQDLVVLSQKCDQQLKQTRQMELQKADIEHEIKDLSHYLFEQANTMVTNEKEAQHFSEKELAQAERELDEAREELEKERVQLKELRRMLGEKEKTREEGIEWTDQEGLESFRQVMASNATLEYLHRLPFLKQCLIEDVTPCLRSGFSRSAVKKILDSVVHGPCFIEHTTQPETKRLSLVARFRSMTASQCYGCGSKMQADIFRFKLKEQDLEWQVIDRACRNRLVTVCNFYAFIRHMRFGLQATRSLDSLHKECFQLKLDMFYARSGMDIKR
ncbi:hypothetical protein CU098_001526, partial [Rhizopus stolonifer]